MPYYPGELLTARYSIDFDMFVRKNYKELSREQALIVDFVKLDEQGVGLKNVILTNEVWGSLSKNEKKHVIVHILKKFHHMLKKMKIIIGK